MVNVNVDDGSRVGMDCGVGILSFISSVGPEIGSGN